ncbi:MAG: hypothetical protein ACRDH9_06060 [Actinomycetota bacterium]
MSSLPSAARRVLNEGTLCYLGAPSAAGPHLTPVVFVLDGDRVWGTTGRNTTKAKLWRRDPMAGGLIGFKGSWLSFRGAVTLYDALDPSTWPASLRRGPRVASASVRFTIKNARFFAGYARDATHVPFAWTPPGRVVFSVELESGAVIEEERVSRRWGAWGKTIEGSKSFRLATPGLAPDVLPADVRELLERPGQATVALQGADGPVVLPARWSGERGTMWASLSAETLSLGGPRVAGKASLVVDQASEWRAAKMRGVMFRGLATAYVTSEVRSGRAELKSQVHGLTERSAAIRIRPRTAVWWSGWASGTVRPS